MYKALLGATVIAMVLSVSACGGSTTTVKQTETQGKQLMDLKEAKDQGVITEKEYKSTKKKILSGK
jgi:hypothetical protein